jgi:hypothetical protein
MAAAAWESLPNAPRVLVPNQKSSFENAMQLYVYEIIRLSTRFPMKPSPKLPDLMDFEIELLRVSPGPHPIPFIVD